MTIDTATWKARESFMESSVDFHVALRSMDDTLNTDVALLYVLRDEKGVETLFADDVLNIENSTDLKSLAFDPPAHVKGRQHHIISYDTPTSRFTTDVSSSKRACPIAVRLIPKNDVALYAVRGAHASDTRAQLIARARTIRPTADTGVLRVRLLRGSLGMGVLAENATDSVLTNMVVALVVDPTDTRYPSVAGRSRRDTFEFALARIQPREVVTRTRPSGFTEGATTAVSYPSRSVLGRKSGGSVSGKPRVNRVVLNVFQRTQNAGAPVELRVNAYDTLRGMPSSYFDLPAHWSVSSAGANAFLTDTTNRDAILNAENEGVVKVTVTIGGVTASKEVTFTTDPRSVTGPVVYGVVRRVLPDGSIEYLNDREVPHEANASINAFMLSVRHLCTIRPNGTVKYATWIRPWAARYREERVTRHNPRPPNAPPDSATLFLRQLEECRV